MSNYPNNLDNDATLPRIDDEVTEITADSINPIRDAVLSVETAVGTNPQGNKPDLNSRISVSIDENGNIKASALASQGLVTLPIYDNEIATNAAIKESKLALDYKTATLYAQINYVSNQLSTLGTAIINTASDLADHVTGISERHDGYMIDLQNPLYGQTTVEAGLDAVNNALIDHENSTTAHAAKNITVDNTFFTFSATNVQEALNDIDNSNNTVQTLTQRVLHTNCVALDAYNQNVQGTDTLSTLLTTVYQTQLSPLLTSNILQVMPPNVARVTSLGLNMSLLSAGTATNLSILATGVTAAPLTISLSSLVNTNNVQNLVDTINKAAHSIANHYPISAYLNGDEITIAHHFSGADYQIAILNSGVTASAATALGFGNVADGYFGYSGTSHSAYVDGYRITDLETLLKVSSFTLTTPSSTLNINMGNLDAYGINGNVLLHINNFIGTDGYSNPSINGTYYIIGQNTTSSINISSTIPAGTFDIYFISDSIAFGSATSGNIYDVFLSNGTFSGLGLISSSLRATYNTIAGLVLTTLNNKFAIGSTTLNTIGSTSVNFIDPIAGINGTPQSVVTGFVGPLTVYGADNVGEATVQITGNLGSSSSNVIVFENAASETLFHLSSVHFGGSAISSNNILKFVTDKRVLGGTVKNTTNDQLDKIYIEDTISDLRNNGVIDGLDVLSFTANTITLRGGRAYVEGKTITLPTTVVNVNSLLADTNLILLDKYGKYSIVNSGNPGYSFSDLTSGDSYGDNRYVATIAQFVTSGTAITSTTDVRFFIDKLDKRVYDSINSITTLVNNFQAGAAFGSGAAGQVTYWSSANTVAGSNNLFWDSVNNHLGIGSSTTSSYILNVQNSTASSGINIGVQPTVSAGLGTAGIGVYSQNGTLTVNFDNTVSYGPGLSINTTSASSYISLNTGIPTAESFVLYGVNNIELYTLGTKANGSGQALFSLDTPAPTNIFNYSPSTGYFTFNSIVNANQGNLYVTSTTGTANATINALGDAVFYANAGSLSGNAVVVLNAHSPGSSYLQHQFSGVNKFLTGAFVPATGSVTVWAVNDQLNGVNAMVYSPTTVVSGGLTTPAKQMTFAGDISATGGYRQTVGPATYFSTVFGSTSTQPMIIVIANTIGPTYGTTPFTFVPSFSGSIVSLSIYVTALDAGASIGAKTLVNGVQSVAITTLGAGANFTTSPKDFHTFNAGDVITINMVNNLSSGANINCVAFITIEM